MSRNFKKEAEWVKNNYKRFEVRLPNEIASEFKDFLEKNNLTFSEWCKKKVQKELSKK